MTQTFSQAVTRACAALIFVAALVFPAGSAFAAGVLDQTSPVGGASFNVGTSSLVWQQQIKVGLAGNLAGITVTLAGSAAGSVTIGVRKGAAPSSQPLLFQGTANYTASGFASQQVFVDMSAANITLAVGDIFVMEVNGNSGLSLIGSYVAPPGMQLYSQPLYINGAPQADGGWRFGFMTYMSCSPGSACNDGNPCTTNDTCNAAGVCVGAPVTCVAMDQCHTAGTCNVNTGICSNPTLQDGTQCNDGNACTQTDTCVSGVCTGSSPVNCTASDSCHSVGTCDPTTGACSNPAKADGTACNDMNACTQTDTCMAGVCSGASPVMCPPPDQCHTGGTCDMTTGMCSNPVKADGTACNDMNACTQNDSCAAGVCAGTAVQCAAMDACHSAGTCDPTTGACSNPTKADGTSCDDGNKCTQTDTCQTGACKGGNPITCMAADACHVAGTCDPQSGACSNPKAPDGTACPGGTCTNGTCQSGTTSSTSSTTTGATTSAGAGGSGSTGATTTGTGGAGASAHSAGGCACSMTETNGRAGYGAAFLLMVALRRRSRRAVRAA